MMGSKLQTADIATIPQAKRIVATAIEISRKTIKQRLAASTC
jgi:hypothetical protein